MNRNLRPLLMALSVGLFFTAEAGAQAKGPTKTLPHPQAASKLTRCEEATQLAERWKRKGEEAKSDAERVTAEQVYSYYAQILREDCGPSKGAKQRCKELDASQRALRESLREASPKRTNFHPGEIELARLYEKYIRECTKAGASR